MVCVSSNIKCDFCVRYAINYLPGVCCFSMVAVIKYQARFFLVVIAVVVKLGYLSFP